MEQRIAGAGNLVPVKEQAAQGGKPGLTGGDERVEVRLAIGRRKSGD